MSTATTETKKASPAPKAVAVIFGIPLVIGGLSSKKCV